MTTILNRKKTYTIYLIGADPESISGCCTTCGSVKCIKPGPILLISPRTRAPPPPPCIRPYAHDQERFTEYLLKPISTYALFISLCDTVVVQVVNKFHVN